MMIVAHVMNNANLGWLAVCILSAALRVYRVYSIAGQCPELPINFVLKATVKY